MNCCPPSRSRFATASKAPATFAKCCALLRRTDLFQDHKPPASRHLCPSRKAACPLTGIKSSAWTRRGRKADAGVCRCDDRSLPCAKAKAAASRTARGPHSAWSGLAADLCATPEQLASDSSGSARGCRAVEPFFGDVFFTRCIPSSPWCKSPARGCPAHGGRSWTLCGLRRGHADPRRRWAG